MVGSLTTVTTDCRYLLTAFDRLVEQDWVDEAFAEIRAAAHALRSVHGLNRPTPDVIRGACYLTLPNGELCQGTITDPPAAFPVCSGCGTTWSTPGELARLTFALHQGGQERVTPQSRAMSIVQRAAAQ